MRNRKTLLELSIWAIYVIYGLTMNYWSTGKNTLFAMLLFGYGLNILTFYLPVKFLLPLFRRNRNVFLLLSLFITGYALVALLNYGFFVLLFPVLYHTPPPTTNLLAYLLPTIPIYLTYGLLGIGYYHVIESLKGKIKLAEAETKVQTAENARLNAETKAQTAENARLRAEAATRNEIQMRLVAEQAAKEEELKRLRAEAEAKEKEIELLHTKAKAQHEENLRLQGEAKAKEMENELLRLKIAQLYSQLSPHFLRNVLACIQGYMSDEDDEASDQIANLATLMDYFLRKPGEDFKEMLHEEVKAIEQLIKIIRPQYTDHFALTFSKEGNINGQRIIGHTLITLVENVITYGYLHKPDKPALITLKVSKNQLYFSTFNWVKKNRLTQGSGLGTANVRKMLEIVYPGNHSYTVESDETTYKTELTITL